MSAPGGPVRPSGEQIEISWAGHRAVVVEVGGGLRTYEVDDRHLLHGYAEGEMCHGGMGQLLVPWPNRLRDGRYVVAGETLQLPLTEPERANAIHGLLRWERWSVAERSPDRVVMEHTLYPRPGYPFALHLSAAYRVGPDGLVASVRAVNVGAGPCPYGAGIHPYVRVAGDSIDECWLEAPGSVFLTADDRGIPVGRAEVDGTSHDFRSPRRVGATVLDTGFTDVSRDALGRAWVRLWDSRRRECVGVWMDERYPFYMLFTGDTLNARLRRRSIAVEPMTCAPNALASGDGIVVLAPGESMEASWGITPAPPDR